jgi:hypothetical protein
MHKKPSVNLGPPQDLRTNRDANGVRNLHGLPGPTPLKPTFTPSKNLPATYPGRAVHPGKIDSPCHSNTIATIFGWFVTVFRPYILYLNDFVFDLMIKNFKLLIMRIILVLLLLVSFTGCKEKHTINERKNEINAEQVRDSLERSIERINEQIANLKAEQERLVNASSSENPVVKNLEKKYMELLLEREELHIQLALLDTDR